MNEEKEDPILEAPVPIKEEIPTSTPMETNTDQLPTEQIDEKEKTRLSYDERRLSLLNNPNYGVILAFLDKFRTYIDIEDYPLHLLEENLLSDEENSKRRRSFFFIIFVFCFCS